MKKQYLIASAMTVFLSSLNLYASEKLKEDYESGEIVNELWKLTVDVPEGKLVLTSVIVTGNPYVATENEKEKAPKVKHFERVIYTPSNSYSELIQHKGVWIESDGARPPTYVSTVLGFGQAIEIRDLVRTGGGSGKLKNGDPNPEGVFSSRVRFNFAKTIDDPSNSFEVRFRISSFPLSYFEGRLKGSGLTLPEFGEHGWALTLPSQVDQTSAVEPAADQVPKAGGDEKPGPESDEFPE